MTRPIHTDVAETLLGVTGKDPRNNILNGTVGAPDRVMQSETYDLIGWKPRCRRSARETPFAEFRGYLYRWDNGVWCRCIDAWEVAQ